MTVTSVALATEDELSEAVGLRLLSEYDLLVQAPPMLLRRGGFGYLRSHMESWKQIAQRQIVLLITDLDRKSCPVQLLGEWLGAGRECPERLIFRIAVREIESWLLADHDALPQLLGRRGQPPRAPDSLPDPKRFLLKQAERAPRDVREDLVVRKGVIAQQGIGYNARLTSWVRAHWSPQRAAERSPSLARARRALNRVASSANPGDMNS